MTRASKKAKREERLGEQEEQAPRAEQLASQTQVVPVVSMPVVPAELVHPGAIVGPELQHRLNLPILTVPELPSVPDLSLVMPIFASAQAEPVLPATHLAPGLSQPAACVSPVRDRRRESELRKGNGPSVEFVLPPSPDRILDRRTNNWVISLCPTYQGMAYEAIEKEIEDAACDPVELQPAHAQHFGPLVCSKHRMAVIAVDDQCGGTRVFAVTEFRRTDRECDMAVLERHFQEPRFDLPAGEFTPPEVDLQYVVLIHIQDVEKEQHCGDLALIRGSFAPYGDNVQLTALHRKAVEDLVQYCVNKERRAVARANLRRRKFVSRELPDVMEAFQRLPVRYELVVRNTYESASVDTPEVRMKEVQAAAASAGAVQGLLKAARLRQKAAELTARAAELTESAVDKEASALESAKLAEMFTLQIREKRLMALEAHVGEEIDSAWAEIENAQAAGDAALRARMEQQFSLLKAELVAVVEEAMLATSEGEAHAEWRKGAGPKK